jgi:2-haloacid dehalogenase
MRLSDFKALTFDCYGTLIDWESGILAALNPLVDRVSLRPSKDAVLEAHARHESSQQTWTPAMPYQEILSVTYKRLAEEWGIAVTWNECETYGHSVKNWPAFADTVESLTYLKRYYKLIILSNVDNTSFSQSNNRLQVVFDAVFTAQDIGSYKPSLRNFTYMTDKLAQAGLTKTDILHTAESLFHDHIPANEHGLASCWIHRRHAQTGFGATMNPGKTPKLDFCFVSLSEMVAAHRLEQTT